MARDIDIDIDELEKFIDVLRDFQDITSDKFKAVQQGWNHCDESWEGDSKERFTKDFEETCDRVTRTLESGDDALEWLRKYLEILKDLENSY
ncbi:hypothetical protein [Geminocystis herdmanii]|uniref:hypothetical protein n=1 Tax=Geminocystis herdmanii TaxID=669359 RepID=UPI000349FBF5|nr:hypothetical protein [Geminocystis herdmanii]